MRPTAFQSMRRMSSPGAYSLCSENSIDAPVCGFPCSPAKAPSTITRARTLIDSSNAMSSGSSASDGMARRLLTPA